MSDHPTYHLTSPFSCCGGERERASGVARARVAVRALAVGVGASAVARSAAAGAKLRARAGLVAGEQGAAGPVDADAADVRIAIARVAVAGTAEIRAVAAEAVDGAAVAWSADVVVILGTYGLDICRLVSIARLIRKQG